MSVYGLYIALRRWKEKPCFDTFVGIYKVGFDKNCRWSTPRKLIRVSVNILSGKYEKFYKYYSGKFGIGD